MNPGSREAVRAFVVDEICRQLAAQGRPVQPDEISDDCDLLVSGLMDSLGVLELMVALSSYAGFELDFEELDPNDMTIVGPLCDFVAAQVAGRQAS